MQTRRSIILAAATGLLLAGAVLHSPAQAKQPEVFTGIVRGVAAGGYDPVAYFTEGQWAPHPGTGEEVRFYCSGMCSTDFAVRFYDVDCNALNITEEEKAELWEAVRQRNPKK